MKNILLFWLCITTLSLQAQNMIKGTVKDEDGAPLIGVSVYEKGTTNGAVTNGNGFYALRYSNANSVIVFSYIGYQSQEIKAGTQTELNVTMKQGNDLKAVEIVGSRRPNRTQTETLAAVDIIDVSRVTSTSGQLDVNQLLQYLAPSFNSNKQSGADGADHIDPATLRGLGPDQTLVLINGKRRHQSSLINVYGTRGRGNTGTDLNAIPASAIDRIEILRDGAAAQYGSDAIAGVINIVLKSNINEFTGSVYGGMYNTQGPDEAHLAKNPDSYDGQTIGINGNFGVAAGKEGYINFTLDYLKKENTNRAPDAEYWNNINGVYRNQFGDAGNENFGLLMNAQWNAGDNAEIYAFGGYNYRQTNAYAFTRFADEERNVTEIYPNGFDPKIQSVINDKSLSLGVKSKLSNWNMDLNNTIGMNKFHFFVDNTLNATLLQKSPTRFDAGATSLMQNTTGINFSRMWDDVLQGFSLALGSEFRIENYKIDAGEEGSYTTYGKVVFATDSVFDDQGNFVTVDTTFRPGGSQGFPGFQPSNVVNESRTNIGLYADAELDITKAFVVSVAARFENYSDFGNTFNGKLATRYKIVDWLSVRASASTGFRAPSLAQLYYNTTFTDIIAGNFVDKIIAENNSPITRALGIPELKQEKSTNYAAGITFSKKAFSATIDFYHVEIKDRIVLTGTFYDDDPEIGADLQAQNVSAAQFFTNAVNTSTNGIDAVITYSMTAAEKHVLRFSLAGNFNKMEIDEIYTNDKLKGKENIYFGVREQYFLLASAPSSKISFGVNYSIKNFYADLRFTHFGEVKLVNFNDNGDDVVTASDDPYANELDLYKAKFTTDLAVGYKFKNISLTVGGANLLNQYPDPVDPGLSESGGTWDAVQMGFAGAFYYAKVGFKF